jgi:hypothetical protein
VAVVREEIVDVLGEGDGVVISLVFTYSRVGPPSRCGHCLCVEPFQPNTELIFNAVDRGGGGRYGSHR